jgi:phosphonate transport system substrate-binding protein
MRKLFISIFLGAITLTNGFAYADNSGNTNQLDIGVVPYTSARALVASYEPIRLYLEQALGRPVKIYTAPGFKPFFLNAEKGYYDLVISPAHFARLLQKEHKFTPLLRYSAGGRGLIMTALNSPVKTPQDLRGKVIALPDQLSLASIICMSNLLDNGLQPGVDFQLLDVPSFASAILAVQKGDAVAAVSAPGALAQMPPELRDSVRPVLDTGEYINLIYLVHPRLGNDTAEQIKKALYKFGNGTSEGKQFFSGTGFGHFVPATAKEMNSLDRYVAETKRLLIENP